MQTARLDTLLEKNIVPDWIIRVGIRRLNKKRIAEESGASPEARQERFGKLLERLRASPIAVHTQEANDQHYELPPEFFRLVLGRQMKYSSAYWDAGTLTLDQAEEQMLSLTVERAGIKNGDSILEIGCGWGSLTLFMADRFPRSQITAVSNSAPQRRFIEARAKERGLRNIKVLTADISDFRLRRQFDRIVSVEMFEHARNYDRLFGKVAGMLRKGGTLFVHVFAHRELAYLFEPKDASDWMARYFFTGGTMPSNHLFLYFAAPHFRLDKHWVVDGRHYARTSEAWLENMDAHRDLIMVILRESYGSPDALRWFSYWRIFFMAVAELFRTRGGSEWMVNHYLFRK